MVGQIGGLFSTMDTTGFWLLHAGIAAAGGAGFLLFRLAVWGRHMPGKGLQGDAPSA